MEHETNTKSLSLKQLVQLSIGLSALNASILGYQMYLESRPSPPLSEQVKNLQMTQKSLYEEMQKIKEISKQK